ncbi:hypothetical protein JCM10512_677 [Bacteroides reticulotermitis JCM 10512]|uniref:Uncharacterized protein n=1 Tax=Bacteroides reticulotermitis JCM 10512 TaxID=1445607 RepID=W4UNU0_9BACE|nr:hypothetical protein JCM10512_677 [Bacteroides reticulotermitis JCM 10512]
MGFLLFLGLLSACRKEQKEAIVPDSLSALREMITPAYVIDADSIRTIIRAELTTWRLDAPWILPWLNTTGTIESLCG